MGGLPGRGTFGKSGGVRVIYFFRHMRMPLYLITVYAKSAQDNLTKAERNAMKQLVTVLANEWEKRNG